MHVRHAEGLAHMICVIFLSMCWLAVTELVYDGPSVDHADEVALLQVKSSLAKVATTAPGGSLQAAISPELSQKVQSLKEQSHTFLSANRTSIPSFLCQNSQTCKVTGDWTNVAQGAKNMAEKYCALHDKLYANHSQLHNWFDVDHDLYDKTSQGYIGEIDMLSLVVFLIIKSGTVSTCQSVGTVLGGNVVGLSTLPALFAMSNAAFESAYPDYQTTWTGLRDLGCACS
eukprot:gnl/TRDRNA2_/TRDRNA2_131782_c0_seq1.p1 gnl/TRDRNA2_/TRDRNA2_131782_c0~~gnl/TRDRNA2_/TRDRNA2_131782_c0_seq1.p1  ORF type:complete len:229 (+),score=17.80 gnl/TRDRNA2_/TRDRNA2_131782_c0_seq1:49-735(+)